MMSGSKDHMGNKAMPRGGLVKLGRDQLTKAGKIRARYGKKGGKIQLCMDPLCKSQIRMTLDRMEEQDSNGVMIQVAQPFNASDFSWSDPVSDTSVDGVKTINVSFQTMVNVGQATTQLTVETWLFLNDGKAPDGDDWIDVPAGALKFTITVEDWPWQDTSHTLAFGVDIDVTEKSTASTRHSKHKHNPQGRRRGKTMKLGDDKFMEAPETYHVDKNATSSGVALPLKIKKKPKGKDVVSVDWVFPYFKKVLVFNAILGDETITAEDVSSLVAEGVEEEKDEDEDDVLNHASSATLSTIALMVALCLMV